MNSDGWTLNKNRWIYPALKQSSDGKQFYHPVELVRDTSTCPYLKEESFSLYIRGMGYDNSETNQSI